jgi:Co/Zn/Cd efflux system component
MDDVLSNQALRRVVLWVALLNLTYFGIEFMVARTIGSVSLFADSIDFLEDASVNLLILIALSWTAKNRARLGMALAGILLVPGLATLWTVWQKFTLSPWPDLVVGLGIAVMNADAAREVWEAAKNEHHSAET